MVCIDVRRRKGWEVTLCFIGWEQDEKDRDRMALVDVCIRMGIRGNWSGNGTVAT